MGTERYSGSEPRSDAVRVAYGICSYESNAMKSPNPHSGIYVAETARTLDFNGGNPACNQGGGACTVHQNGSGEVQMSEVCYTVSTNSNASGRNTPLVLVYGFDWQEERNIGGGGWYMEECAKTITSTKPGAVLVLNDQGGA